MVLKLNLTKLVLRADYSAENYTSISNVIISLHIFPVKHDICLLPKFDLMSF